VDMGAGALLRTGHNAWVKYYNKNNKINGNIIHDVSRAGVWVGYTENEEVSGNRIYNVTGAGANTYFEGGPVTIDAGGILAGGDRYPGWKGFNNMNLTIKNNEVSNVQSNYLAYGIKVEQSQSVYPKSPEDAVFPDGAENTKVFNNIVWGINPGASASRVGIRVYTERESVENFLEAYTPTYFTRGDLVLNNTVIMPDDQGETSGGLSGIAVQHSKGTKILNNAVAILDNYVDVENCPASALIFYQGIMPGHTDGLESNRNALWTVPAFIENEGPSVYGFVEMDEAGDFIEPLRPEDYILNGYETLRQWRNWTEEDMNSVYANFTNDLEYTGTLVQYLRVKNYPRPIGSVLNDRGYRTHEYLEDTESGFEYDAFDQGRGINGQLYDIGAEEFEGRTYISDVEFQMISSPKAYKSGSGIYSDAENVMTMMPIQLKTILRNSGTLFQAAVKVRLEVICSDAGIHYYDTLTTDIIVAQSKEVTFDIPDELIMSYSDLEEAGMHPVVPVRFDPTMKANVTPIYTFKIEVQADENNYNNFGETDVRFYLRRSNKMLMLISAEHANTLVENEYGPVRTIDEIAGRLNYKSLEEAFNGMSLHPEINKDIDNPGEENDTFKIDVFDRLSWEPKSVDYRMYKYVFWSDRDDSNSTEESGLNTLKRYQQWDIDEFLNAGTVNNKRNLVIASQEAIRNIYLEGDEKSIEFVNNELRALNTGGGYAWGDGTNCNDSTMKGVALGLDIIQKIENTGIDYTYGGTTVVDQYPQVGVIDIYTRGEGLAKATYKYAKDEPNVNGVAMTTLTKNIVYIGTDWRHFADAESVLRQLLDWYDDNGGTEVPIELTNFEVKPVTNRVDIRWTTASELNSDRFEVERAGVVSGVKGSFRKIAERQAAGKSEQAIEYGPVTDREVKYGERYIYRLKLIDRDGRYEYSDEKMVEIGGEGMWLGEARPNPVRETASFDISIVEGTVDVYLYDMSGRKFEVRYNIEEGKLELNLSNISSGTYTLVVSSGDVMMTRQFSVVK